MRFARAARSRDDFRAKQSAMPLEIHMREDGDNSAQSEQMPSALALVLHNTQSTLVLGSLDI